MGLDGLLDASVFFIRLLITLIATNGLRTMVLEK